MDDEIKKFILKKPCIIKKKYNNKKKLDLTWKKQKNDEIAKKNQTIAKSI